MRVLFYIQHLTTKGGAEKVVLELTKHLFHKGHDVTILTHHYTPDSTFKELSSFKIISNKSGRLSKGFFRKGASFFLDPLFTKIDLKKYDIMLVYTTGFGELISLRNHSIPLVCLCNSPLRMAHDPEARKKFIKSRFSKIHKKIVFNLVMSSYKLFEKKAWGHFDHVVSISENTRGRILAADLASPEKISIAYPGVDLDDFLPTWEYQKYFFVPGRISEWKRQDLAIKAFLEFSKNKKGFKLVVAGNAPSNETEYLEQLKTESNNDVIFKIAPEDETYLKLYKSCYAVLFTALNEDWGIVPLEGMACAKPVISVNEGGPRESIIDGKTGFLVDSDVISISDKMLLLANNSSLLKEMGMGAREHSFKFTWEKFGDNLEKTLISISKTNRKV